MSVKNLVETLESLEKFTTESVHGVVSECDIRAEDIEREVDYDYPVSDSYGRKMVHNGSFFEIMIMSWRPGDYSGIHDHGKAEFGAVKTFGAAEHAIFKLKNKN